MLPNLCVVLSGIFLSMAIIMSPDNKILAVQPVAQSETDTVVTSSNLFAVDLYAKLAAGSEKNLFFSPESISSILSMTYVARAAIPRRKWGKCCTWMAPATVLLRLRQR